jgi:DNA-binding winged helix-turn-helix (wHTH) protein
MRATKSATGEIELDLGRYELRRRGQRVKLEKKPMELLIFLVSRPRTIGFAPGDRK